MQYLLFVLNKNKKFITQNLLFSVFNVSLVESINQYKKRKLIGEGISIGN